MRRYVFADEAGDFAFSRHQRASKYFIICTATLDSCDVGEKLLRLRRELAWDGLPVRDQFHACEDKQVVRDRVFQLLSGEQFSVQATILEKSKAQPQTRVSNHRFYQYGWHYHFKNARAQILSQATELHVTAATIGQKKTQKVFSDCIADVLQQHYGQRATWRADYVPSLADPCLQAADYCTWALQRKWERGDARAYDLISAKITREYDLFAGGNRHYY